MCILIALTTFAVTFVRRRFFSAPSESIAVLPFQNGMADPQMDYLSRGITETLIQDLSRIPPHRVLSLAAVARYEKHSIDPIQAGRDLHVDRVLSGSISRVDDELLIEAELSDVHTGKRTWGHTYRRKSASLSATLEEFSTEVTDGLRLHLSGPLKDRLNRQYSVGSESYRDYLKARFEMSKRTTEGLDAAMRLFDEVIARDPAYAPAWAGQARVYNLMAFFGARGAGQEPLEALRRSQAAAAHALDLDSTLAEAWSSLAYVQMQADYQWAEAEKNFHRALELDPNWPDTHDAYGYELTALGRFDEAIREIKIAEKRLRFCFPSKTGWIQAQWSIFLRVITGPSRNRPRLSPYWNRCLQAALWTDAFLFSSPLSQRMGNPQKQSG
jgi:TolB-like protein